MVEVFVSHAGRDRAGQSGGLAVGLCQVIGGVDYWDWKAGENFATRPPLPPGIDHLGTARSFDRADARVVVVDQPVCDELTGGWFVWIEPSRECHDRHAPRSLTP